MFRLAFSVAVGVFLMAGTASAADKDVKKSNSGAQKEYIPAPPIGNPESKVLQPKNKKGKAGDRTTSSVKENKKHREFKPAPIMGN